MSEKIGIKNLSLVYGKNPASALELIGTDNTIQEIYSATGCVVAVRDVSLSVQEHETMVIMGLSGCGKSSLLKCLNLLNRPNAGSITVGGDNILDYDKAQLRKYRQKTTCMVFQSFGLFKHRTVIQNVEFGLEVSGVDKKTRRERAREMINLVGLSEWEDKKPRELSGGMQQRVGLARALANDPEILLMDEPFSALDPLIRQQMQTELLRLQQVIKKTIVFITHDIDEAFLLGDSIAIMKDGEFQQTGTPAQILHDPKTQYVSDFVRNLNRERIQRERGNLELLEATEQQ